jgi:hypothetical protein
MPRADVPGVNAPHTARVVDDTPESPSVLGDILMPHYRVRVASPPALLAVQALHVQTLSCSTS